MSEETRILGIETSCDETAASVVENGRFIRSSIVASQAAQHAQYGGVFPEVASRMHVESFYAVVEQALSQAHAGLEAIDAVAVTRGPGVAGGAGGGGRTGQGGGGGGRRPAPALCPCSPPPPPPPPIPARG